MGRWQKDHNQWAALRIFQQGESPRGGLLRDCEIFTNINSFEALEHRQQFPNRHRSTLLHLPSYPYFWDILGPIFRNFLNSIHHPFKHYYASARNF